MRLAVGSLARAPGATTWALACSAASPDRAGVLVEADADGGVLAARGGLSLHPDAPTLASLLAAVRHSGPTSAGLADYVQVAASGVRVVCGPSMGEPAAAAAALLADRVDELTSDNPSDVVVDVGRVRAGSPAWRLAAACDVRMVVVRPVLEELEPLLARADALAGLGPLVVIVRGRGAYAIGEIAAAFGERAGVWSAPDDEPGVAVLAGQRRGRLERTALVRSATGLLLSLPVGERVR